jgi:hypothetical protein
MVTGLADGFMVAGARDAMGAMVAARRGDKVRAGENEKVIICKFLCESTTSFSSW